MFEYVLSLLGMHVAGLRAGLLFELDWTKAKRMHRMKLIVEVEDAIAVLKKAAEAEG